MNLVRLLLLFDIHTDIEKGLEFIPLSKSTSISKHATKNKLINTTPKREIINLRLCFNTGQK